MRRLSIILFLFYTLILTACAVGESVPPGNYVVYPANPRTQIVPITITAEGYHIDIRNRPTAASTKTVTVYPTYTPLPTYTKYPTYTPAVSTPTETDEPSPTPEAQTETVTFEPGDPKVCLVRTLITNHLIRADHAVTAAVVGSVPVTQYATVISVYVIVDVYNEWLEVNYKRENGTVVHGWMFRDNSNLLFGADDTLEICLDTDLTPTIYVNNPPPSPVPTVAAVTPTPLPPPTGCEVFNPGGGNINVRTGPGTSYAVLYQLKSGESGLAVRVQIIGADEWAYFSKLSVSGQNVYGYAALKLNGAAIARLRGNCASVPRRIAVGNTAGLHTLGFSVNTYAVLSVATDFGFLKLTDDAYALATEARKLNPDILIVHRNIFLMDVGRRDCPTGYGMGNEATARSNAQAWFSLQYRTLQARNLLGQGVIDWHELQNECGYPGATYENAYWLEMLRLAKEKGLCLAVYSDSYGTPEIDQFVSRRPVFDRILSDECQPGRHHIVSLHTYGNVASGEWIFGRWLKFRAALGSQYDELQYVFTEFGVTNAAGNNDGRGSPDCGMAAHETLAAVAEYKKHPEVLGFALFSVGPGSEWVDLTSCLLQIADGPE